MAMVPVRVMVGVRANAYKTLLLNKNQPQSWTAHNICQAMAKKMAVSNGGRKCSDVDYGKWVLSYNTMPLDVHQGKVTGRKMALPKSYHQIGSTDRVLELEHDGRGIFASENMPALELVFHEDPAVGTVNKQQQDSHPGPLQRLKNRMSPRVARKQVGSIVRNKLFSSKRP
jgi:hypothetical protein